MSFLRIKPTGFHGPEANFYLPTLFIIEMCLIWLIEKDYYQKFKFSIFAFMRRGNFEIILYQNVIPNFIIIKKSKTISTNKLPKNNIQSIHHLGKELSKTFYQIIKLNTLETTTKSMTHY